MYYSYSGETHVNIWRIGIFATGHFSTMDSTTVSELSTACWKSCNLALHCGERFLYYALGVIYICIYINCILALCINTFNQQYHHKILC